MKIHPKESFESILEKVQVCDMYHTLNFRHAQIESTVKPMLETTYIKRPPALRDHCSDTTTLPKINLIEPAFKDHLL